jgi:hypothetical protein
MMKKEGKASQKNLLITLIVAVVVIGGIFLLLSSSARASPTESYLNYRADFDKMQTFDDYLEVAQEHGSPAYVSEVKNYRDSLQVVPESMRLTLIGLVKSLSPPASELEKENLNVQINGDTATLSINARSGALVGSVKLVKVNGQWKVEKDDWHKGPNA